MPDKQYPAFSEVEFEGEVKYSQYAQSSPERGQGISVQMNTKNDPSFLKVGEKSLELTVDELAVIQSLIEKRRKTLGL